VDLLAHLTDVLEYRLMSQSIMYKIKKLDIYRLGWIVLKSRNKSYRNRILSIGLGIRLFN